MTSSKPYMIRAVYEWLMDNALTPHVLVATDMPMVEVPVEYVRDGRIVLNISTSAVQGLHMANDALTFSARFGGVPRSLYIPVTAVLGIYARENGQGMFFEDDEPQPPEDAQPPKQPDPSGEAAAKRPSLRVVK